MNHPFFLYLTLTTLLLTTACQTSMPSFEEAELHPADHVTTLHPPTASDLIMTPPSLAITSIDVSETSDLHQNWVSDFLKELLQQEGKLMVLPKYRVQQAVQSQQSKLTEPLNTPESALTLGRYLKADYAMLLQISPLPQTLKGAWKAKVSLQVLHTPSSKEVWNESFEWNSQRLPQLWRQLTSVVQQTFPQKGFILETRNQRQLGKINLGTNHEIQVGRRFQVFQRTIQETSENDVITKEVFYSPVGFFHVKHVTPEASYGVILQNEPDSVFSGDVVFSLPEKQ